MKSLIAKSFLSVSLGLTASAGALDTHVQHLSCFVWPQGSPGISILDANSENFDMLSINRYLGSVGRKNANQDPTRKISEEFAPIVVNQSNPRVSYKAALQTSSASRFHRKDYNPDLTVTQFRAEIKNLVTGKSAAVEQIFDQASMDRFSDEQTTLVTVGIPASNVEDDIAQFTSKPITGYELHCQILYTRDKDELDD